MKKVLFILILVILSITAFSWPDDETADPLNLITASSTHSQINY